jgi:hypothetical protein
MESQQIFLEQNFSKKSSNIAVGAFSSVGLHLKNY